MKMLKITMLGGMILLLLSSAALLRPGEETKNKIKSDSDSAGFAVLELFTSEGCSSCPRADDLMARIQKESVGKTVYILSYHVDYWNHLGWKDIFSSPKFTERQKKYNQWFTSQLYTPQLIVNGSREFVGSDASGIRNAIEANLALPASVSLNLKVQQQKENIVIDYEFTGNSTSNEQLLIAIIQKHATRNVKHGENGGHLLSHVQIVNQLYSFSLNKKQSEQVHVPDGFTPEGWEVIAMVQNIKTGYISAATRALFPASNKSL